MQTLRTMGGVIPPGVRRGAWRVGPSCLAFVLSLCLTGCGGSPPTSLAGFTLGMSQEAVLAETAAQGNFNCRLRGVAPAVTLCEGITADGQVRVVVHDGAAVSVSLQLEPAGRRPERAVNRFVRRFGAPAWRERPYPPREPRGYHTLWLDRDSTRSLAMICSGRRLEPPCSAELSRTAPSTVQAQLDALLEIQR